MITRFHDDSRIYKSTEQIDQGGVLRIIIYDQLGLIIS